MPYMLKTIKKKNTDSGCVAVKPFMIKHITRYPSAENSTGTLC